MARKITGKMTLRDVYDVRVYGNGLDGFRVEFMADGEAEATIYLDRYFMAVLLGEMQKVVRDWVKVMDEIRKRFGV